MAHKSKQSSSFPGEVKKKLGSSGHGFSSPGYKAKKKTSSMTIMWQNRKRKERDIKKLKKEGKYWRKPFSSKPRKSILV